ncbi:MAG: DUF6141 family protein [Bacteroidales bacterium]|mgnify:CR=1 FL=1|nr:DUF6141 family protein [Bacteroidales bacterium]MCF8396941.1 DUF6141 family protein [Bacteroidales bacterium]
MSKIYFKETQKFRQWWILVILLIVLCIWLWGIIQQIVFEIPFGNNPISDLGLVLIGIIVLAPIVIIFRIKMISQIRRDGIWYKMYPLTTYKKIRPEEVKNWHIRQYNPVREFGGWGMRFALQRGKGKAINLSSRNGLQLELKSGKKLLIGTQNPEKMKEAMEKMFKPNKL